MNLLMIAVIQQNKNIIGFRMFDTEAKEKKYMDVPAASVKQVIESGKAEIANLGVLDGELVATNGSFERYPKIATNGVLISQTSPLVIINQLGDVGYTVVDYKGTVKKARTSDVVEYAKNHGIANGKVVIKDNIEFISSIAGTYEVEKLAPSKVKNDDSVKIHMTVSNSGRPADSVSRHANVDVEIEIDENDVFDAMDEAQKMAIKAYYTWYTVDKYKSLAKSVRLNLAVGKAEKLAELRGITNWEFGGVWDSGYMGGSKCELGHTLRYEYYAIPSDDKENPDARIIFGETCASDFFNIDPEDMKNLVKTRTIMSDEIKLLADILTNGQEKLYMGKAELLYGIIRKLGTKEKITGVFGEKVGTTLISFVITKLPFPMSLVLEASKQVSKNVPDFFNKVFPEYRNALREAFSGNKNSGLIEGLNEYLRFIGTNKIEGDYAYNPLDESIKRRDIGNYNKQSRWQRENTLRRHRSKVLALDYTFEELDAILNSADMLIDFRHQLLNKIKDTEFSRNSIKIIRLAKEFAESQNVSTEIKNERFAVYNSLITVDDYGQFNSKPSYYSDEKGYTDYHRYIKYFRDDLKRAEAKFGNILNDFYNSCIVSEEERQERERAERERIRLEREKERKAEEERQERERAERDRLRLAREEADKIERERQLKEMEEINRKAREVKEAEDLTTKLKNLMEKHPEVAEDYGIKTAKSILESGKLYGELSHKQQWRIDETIKQYESHSNQDKTEAVNTIEENKSYNLDQHQEIKEKVQRVINKADDVEMQEVLKVSPNVLKIAYSIIRYNKASDKQLKHINKAIEILDQA